MADRGQGGVDLGEMVSAYIRSVLCVGLLAWLAGCVSVKVEADSEIASPVDVASNEAVAFHLASFSAIGDETGDALELEQALDACLQREIVRARPTLKFIGAKSLRSALPTQAVPAEAPDPRAFLSIHRQRFGTQGRPAYLILLDAKAQVGDPKWNAVAGLGVGAGREREVTLYLTATILDVARDRVLGDARASAHGRRGGFFGMFLFVIPFGGMSDVRFDEELCASLGRTLSERMNAR